MQSHGLLLMDSSAHISKGAPPLLEIVAHLVDLLYRHLFDISRVLTAAVVAVPAATSQVVVAYLVELLTLTIVAWFACAIFLFWLCGWNAIPFLIESWVVVTVEEAVVRGCWIQRTVSQCCNKCDVCPKKRTDCAPPSSVPHAKGLADHEMKRVNLTYRHRFPYWQSPSCSKEKHFPRGGLAIGSPSECSNLHSSP